MWSSFFILLIYFAKGFCADNECSKNEDCMVESSICSNGTCICPPDFIFNSEHTKCLRVSHGYGAICTDSLQCSASLQSGGMCNNGTCECSEGYHYFRGQCWKSAGLGEKCVQNMNCYVSYDFEAAICNTDKVCDCSPGYYQREYSSCRRSSQNPGDPCGISNDCKFDHAVCTRDRICGKQTEEKIEEQVEISNSLINYPRMKRNVFTILREFGSPKIGADCTKDSDCPKNAECYENSVCLCLQGFYTNDNNTCHPELGANCTKDEDCLGRNSMCRDSTYCTCKQGFVASYNNRQCDKMSRNISWSCLRDEQCGFFGPGGKCISKKCHCSNSTHWVQQELYCWISKKVGESCEDTEDCGRKDSSMTCSDEKVCTCDAGTHSSSSNISCNKDSKEVGQPCTENIDCLYEHAECNITSHNCSCQKGYLENSTICVSGINGTCKNNGDCAVKNSHCSNNTCACNDGNVASISLAKCLPLANTIGVQCFESVQCTLVSGDCLNNTCLCNNTSKFLPDYQQCYLQSKIGERCSRSQNCSIRHAECSNGYCVCKRGYRPRANNTICSSSADLVTRYNILLVLGAVLSILGINSKNY